MCHRVQLLDAGELAEVVGRLGRQLPLEGLLAPHDEGLDRAEAGPGEDLPAIAAAGGRDGGPAGPGLALESLQWGFPVDWQQGLVYNTRIESALGGAEMWRDALATGRCAVPVAAFFETSDSERVADPETGRPVRRAYRFSMAGGAPMLVAGVSAGGFVSLVTTEPNATVRAVHRRMPLVLYAEEVPTWLGDGFASLADRSGLSMRAEPERLAEPGQESLF